MEQKWGVKLKQGEDGPLECHGRPSEVLVYLQSLPSGNRVMPGIIDRFMSRRDARMLNRRKDLTFDRDGHCIAYVQSVVELVKELIEEDAVTFIFAMRDIGYKPELNGYDISYYPWGKSSKGKRDGGDWISLGEGEDKWNRVQPSERKNS